LLRPRSNGKTRGCECSCKLLMMGEEAPETCWVTHKRQVINLWRCCVLLDDLFELYKTSICIGTKTLKYCVPEIKDRFLIIFNVCWYKWNVSVERSVVVMCPVFKQARKRNGCINYRAVTLLNNYGLPRVSETHRLSTVA
jgi:hypothetical protein